MEYKTLHLNLASAKDIKNVNLFYKMDVYAVVSISGDPLHKQKTKTPLDKEGGTNPTWNFSVKLTFNESLARQNRLILKIKLRCFRNLADKNIGSVKIPLGELLHNQTNGELFQHVSYQVKKPSGKPKGSFNFSYKFNPPMNHKVGGPVTGYPAPAVGTTSTPYTVAYSSHQPQYAYPPPPKYQQPQMGYAYPQQIGYGYPPQNGYGYPAPQAFTYQKSGKSGNVGMGIGAGLVAGALLVDF